MKHSIDRRYFLKSGAVALAGFATVPQFLVRTAMAQTAAGTNGDQPVIVAIFQRGAADGVSMVVPFGDRHYYTARPQIAIPAPRRNGSEPTAIDLDGFFGLHPAMAALQPIYKAGHLAVIHAVGSPSSTRSHFDAQDFMETGTPDVRGVPDGWLNRYLQVRRDNDASPFRAVAMGSSLPRSLRGEAPAVAITRFAEFAIRTGRTSTLPAAFEAMYDDSSAVQDNGTFEALQLLRGGNPGQYKPENGAEYPSGGYGLALLQIAQLIKAGVGLQVAFAAAGGWDTHANQGNARGVLANRLTQFAAGLAAFHQDLGDRMRNIVVITMTEFGRTIRQNGSGGTDHGHASAMFALGGPVKGGKVYGRWPGLDPDQLYEGRDLALTTDFRDVFAEVLTRHMAARDVAEIFPGFRPSRGLGLLGS